MIKQVGQASLLVEKESHSVGQASLLVKNKDSQSGMIDPPLVKEEESHSVGQASLLVKKESHSVGQASLLVKNKDSQSGMIDPPLVEKEESQPVGQASLLVKENSQSGMIDPPLVEKEESHSVGQASLLVKNKDSQSGMIDPPLVEKEESQPVGQASLLVKENSQSGMIDPPSKFDVITYFQVSKRKLPHWQNPGGIYFITSRTNNFEFAEQDKAIIKDALLFHDKKKYNLISYVIMPDHLHIILQPLMKGNAGFYSLSEINHSIKSFTATMINKKDNVKGREVWQHESFDRLIRDEKEIHKFLNYMINNPLKKELTEYPYDYEWLYIGNY